MGGCYLSNSRMRIHVLCIINPGGTHDFKHQTSQTHMLTRRSTQCGTGISFPSSATTSSTCLLGIRVEIVRSSEFCQHSSVRDELPGWSSYTQPIKRPFGLLFSEVTHRRETLHKLWPQIHRSPDCDRPPWLCGFSRSTQGSDVVLHRLEMTKVRIKSGTKS